MNSTAYFWLNFLTVLPQYPLIAWFNGRFIKAKHPYIYMLAPSLTGAAAYVLTQDLPAVQWICTLAVFVVPLLIFSRIPRGQALIYFVIGAVMMMAAELPVDYLAQLFYPGVTIASDLPLHVLCTVRLVSLPLPALVWAFNNRLCGRLMHTGYRSELDRYLPVLGIEWVILFAVIMIYNSLHDSVGPLSLLFLLAVLVGLMALDLLLVRTVRRLDTAHEAELARQQTAELLRSQTMGYKSFCENIENISRLRAGLTQQLQTIAQLLDSGETEKADQQLSLYIDAVSETGRQVFTGNPIADAVINSKTGIMEEAGIRFTNNGTLPEDPAMDPARLCALIANLLDNAIHGCRASAEGLPREITLHAGVNSSRLILRCENTCPADTAVPDDDRIDRNSEHGWGLGILRRIAEENGGDAVFACTGTVFTSVIQLQMQEKEKA